jgi:catechol 2,3-dioxygenase-like lactoylglutathione lyase family enzyme
VPLWRGAVAESAVGVRLDPQALLRVHSGVDIIKLAWMGTRTEHDAATVAFFRDVLGLRPELFSPGFWVVKLPDGSKAEIFGPATEINRHFTTGPVVGFLVDDVQSATAELRTAGVEILLDPELDAHGNAWVHFRNPGRQRLRVDARSRRVSTAMSRR